METITNYLNIQSGRDQLEKQLNHKKLMIQIYTFEQGLEDKLN